MVKKYIDIEGLKYLTNLMKEYVDIKVDLTLNKRASCPNCGAPITSFKCEYCGTDFSVISNLN